MFPEIFIRKLLTSSNPSGTLLVQIAAVKTSFLSLCAKFSSPARIIRCFSLMTRQCFLMIILLGLPAALQAGTRWETLEAIVTLINPETLTIERIPIKVSQDVMDGFRAELEFRRFQISASEAANCWPRNAPQACRPFNRDCPMKDRCLG